jgi:putative membrane protein
MDVRLPIFLFAAALVMGQPTPDQQQPPPPPPSRPQQTQPPPKPQQPPATAQASKAALPASDAQFLKKVNEDNLAEVEVANVANTKSTNDQVKSLASKLLTDHQENQSDLQALASKKNVTLPSDMPASKKSVKDRLSKLDGAAFDKAYIAEMIKDHKAAIAAFERAAKSTDADVKAFAEKTLPTLKEHLSQAQAVKITAPVSTW